MVTLQVRGKTYLEHLTRALSSNKHQVQMKNRRGLHLAAASCLLRAVSAGAASSHQAPQEQRRAFRARPMIHNYLAWPAQRRDRQQLRAWLCVCALACLLQPPRPLRLPHMLAALRPPGLAFNGNSVTIAHDSQTSPVATQASAGNSGGQRSSCCCSSAAKSRSADACAMRCVNRDCRRAACVAGRSPADPACHSQHDLGHESTHDANQYR